MKTIIGLLLTLLLAVPAQAAVVNGGFETGDFTGWSTTGSIGGNASVVGSYTFPDGTRVDPLGGNYMAMIGSETAPTNYNAFNLVLQNITAANPIFTFSYNFWSYDYGQYDTTAFNVEINGDSIFSLDARDVDTDGSAYGFDITGWQTVSFDISKYIVATGGNLTISFMAGDTTDNLYRSGAFIDEVAITPIPGAVWLLGSGLVGLVGLRRRMQA